ncbi:unnamed protein product [Cladocopium goreaui]|uniref:malate dehydrogenase n=1 Tax=Cladocopium goreaui TaxID=2562237 RepID=A0A9P1DK33_9DINO|nr:unnamed protein product [Cladocopium goreaui]
MAALRSLSRSFQRAAPLFSRYAPAASFSTAQFKVCINGGAGGIGQPLTMLMAMNESVKEVSVQDVSMAAVPPAGVAADLGHLEFPSKVVGYATDPKVPATEQLEACLTGCNLVLIPAGMPRKPGMTRDDLFNINADIAKGVVEACAKFCPEAVVGIIVNPVNSIVPAMAELYKKKGLDPLKIVGVTSLDIVRANKFVAEITGKSPADIEVPVIGGHAGVTIMPVFSQDPISATISADKIPALDKRTQDGGTEVVEAKAGKGSATLSMAYSGARFGNKVLKGMAGTPTDECAYVASTVTDLPYFSSKVTFGKTGVEKIHPVGALNSYEEGRLKEAQRSTRAWNTSQGSERNSGAVQRPRAAQPVAGSRGENPGNFSPEKEEEVQSSQTVFCYCAKGISRSSSLVIAPLAAVVLAEVSLRSEEEHADPATRTERSQELPLLDEESNSLFLLLRGMTTVSFCEGPPPLAWLRSRLAAIIAANPWLSGHLRRNGVNDAVSLRFDAAGATREVQLLGSVNISSSTPYEVISQQISGSCAEVRPGLVCLQNSSEPLIRVSLCDGGFRDEFALIVSISHIVADGHTYYKLFEMLTQNVELTSLNPRRKVHFNQKRIQAVGQRQYDFIYSPQYVLNCLSGKLLYGKPRCRAYLVNSERVAEIKASQIKEHPDVPFVSTNDVLTSLFGRLIDARVCSMAINFRNRIAGICEDDAGNYQGLLCLGPKDFAEPASIRRLLQRGGTTGIYHEISNGADAVTPAPDFWQTLKSRLAVMTNWAFNQPQLEQCRMLLHLPHFDLEEVNSDMAVIFRPRAGELAVLTFLKDLDMDELVKEADGILGRPLSPEVFREKKSGCGLHVLQWVPLLFGERLQIYGVQHN